MKRDNLKNGFYKQKGLRLLISFFLSQMIIITGQAQLQDKPNIIFIMSDDHAYQAISAYNPDLISTPNIDKIADEGILFNRAFVTNSLCGPSRAVILTGKYSHINGYKANEGVFKEQETLPKILGRNGYKTAIVGKWHLGSPPRGFDYWNILPGYGDYYNPDFIKMGKDTTYQGYVTDITTDLALSWLDSNANRKEPFFLMIHQKAPHRTQMPPVKYLDLFNEKEFVFPGTFYDDYKNKIALQRNKISIANDLWIDYDSKVACDTCLAYKMNISKPVYYNNVMRRLNPEERKLWDKSYQKEYEEFAQIKTKDQLVKWQYQRFMEDYLRCVQSIDDNVGKVLEYLAKNGLEENTIIIYTSDQGFFLGEHGLYDKRFMYEEAFRTPMMIRYPKKIKPERHIDQMVLNLDIAPTLLDFAGIAPPGDMQGVSMKDLLTKPRVKRWRNEIYYHYYENAYGVTPHYGIRTKQYKLIRFYGPIDSWELYDLKKDPGEMKNIYADPAYGRVTETLKRKLKELRMKYKDDFPSE